MNKGQPKHHSLIEQFFNILSGAVIAFCITQYVFVPIGLLDIAPANNVVLTVSLTFVSIARGYIWRRIFNWYHTRG